jgi:agmatinase
MKDPSYPSFLESELGSVSPQDALFHIIPVPYEKSVSYGRGTANGPAAILTASQQLELFDGISIPAAAGIYTQEPFSCSCSSEELFDRIGENVSAVLKDGKIPITLGGEHAITVGALLGISGRYQDFGIVHFDAHADLRDTYENNKYSHACVMHRALDMEVPIYQIGVRSLSYEEEELRKGRSIGHLDAAQIAATGIPATILPGDFPNVIYLSIDVDVLDPSIMPATGTPEPGGLSWYQMMEIVRTILKDRLVIGFDVVELAPINGLHAGDYTIARLIYNIIGMIVRSRTNPAKS